MAVAASHIFEAPFCKEFHTLYEAMMSDSKLMYKLVKSQNYRHPTLAVIITNRQGDQHCCGVQVVINNTFPASGQVAPIAATIYGLFRREMPGKEDIVAIPIPRLVRGADQNNHSETKGLIVFVRERKC